jgi:hypothetical protein
MGEQRYSSMHSYSRHEMEVSGQLHTQIALSQEKETLVHTGYRQEPGSCGEEKSILPLLGIEPRFLLSPTIPILIRPSDIVCIRKR